MKEIVMAAALVVAASVVGCSDGSGPASVVGGDENRFEGTWMFAADQQDAPRVESCTGDLAGSDFPFCDFVEVAVQQNGTSFSGTGTDVYCGLSYMVSGTVMDDTVAGELAATDASGTTRTQFTGSFTGPNSMTVTLSSLTVDGSSGSCSLAGQYAGNGAPAGPSSVTLTVEPNRPLAGDEATFIVSGQSDVATITGSRIDFDASGTWDAFVAHDGASITQDYPHTYLESGLATVVAQILSGAEVLAEAEITVNVLPVVRLEIVDLSNAPVTAQTRGEGVCTGSRSVTCSSDVDCLAVGGICVGFSCSLEVVDWTGTAANVPVLPSAQSPSDDIVLDSVTISYDWVGGVATTPDRVVGLGGVTIPVNSSNGFSFAPIAFQDLSPAIEGQAATLTLVFHGETVEGVSVSLVVSRQLFVEPCR